MMADRVAERNVVPLKAVYRRVLLKLSGEALMGNRDYGLEQETVDRIAREVQAVNQMGVEVCMVIGGANIFRGVAGASQGMQRASADYGACWRL
jgi:uridylate kinase